jgi:flagellar motor switch protein FliN
VTVTDISIDREQITGAAGVVAEAFGLGQQVDPIDEWPIDDGDEVIRAVVTGGDEPFALYLAVNATIGSRLLHDADRLALKLTDAARLLVAGAELAVTEIETTTDRPDAFVGIFDQSQLSAVFGVAAIGSSRRTDEATPETAASDAGMDAFDPQPFVAGDAQYLVNAGALELLSDVEMEVTVELGRTSMPIRELLSLQPGMVVEIDRVAGAPIDVLVNGRRIASGEVVVIDEEFGVRITEIVAVGDR